MSNDIQRIHREAPFTDVHIHPSLKAWLFDRDLWKHRYSGKTFDPFASRSDFVMLEDAIHMIDVATDLEGRRSKF